MDCLVASLLAMMLRLRDPPSIEDVGKTFSPAPSLFHERARRRQMQGKRIGLVAGARIDFGDDRIVPGDDAVGMAGEALDRLPADAHLTEIVHDRKRTAPMQIAVK